MEFGVTWWTLVLIGGTWCLMCRLVEFGGTWCLMCPLVQIGAFFVQIGAV